MAEPDSAGMPGGFGLRSVMLAARREALLAGARDVRAEHLLLALAGAPDASAARVLAAFGLDREALDAAFTAEREHSLAAVGMPPIPAHRLQSTGSSGTPGWGASAKEALLAGRHHVHVARRSSQASRQLEQRARRLEQTARRLEDAARRIERGEPTHHGGRSRPREDAGAPRGGRTRPGQVSELDLLHAIVSADLGTVPRALALAGIDRAALLDAIDRAAGEA